MSQSLREISEVAQELGIQQGDWIPYGFGKAKIRLAGCGKTRVAGD
jgi:formyltetrahydrofolate synthetase